MRIARIAAVSLAFALAGCIDIDMDVAILGPDQARMSGQIQVARDMFDMMGGGDEFCPADEGGTLELTDEYARCNILMEGTFAEAFPPSEDGSPSPTATDLGDGTVRVTFPMNTLTGDMDDMRSDPNAVAMFRPMMEGYSITLSVSGAEIVSTNGTLSEDGTSASVSFLLTDLLEDEQKFPDLFETVVRY